MSGESGRPTVAGPSDSVPIYEGQGEACITPMLTQDPEERVDALKKQLVALSRGAQYQVMKRNLAKGEAAVLAAKRAFLLDDVANISVWLIGEENRINDVNSQIVALQEEIMLASDARQEVEGE